MMKIAALITTLAMIYGATTTAASECTASQLDAASRLPEMDKFESACADAIASSGVSSSTATVRNICGNKECLAATKAAFKAFPKCEVDGVSLSLALEQIDTACAYVGGSSSTSSSNNNSYSTYSPAPSPTTSAASSTVSGASATAVAVVAAIYTYARA